MSQSHKPRRRRSLRVAAFAAAGFFALPTVDVHRILSSPAGCCCVLPILRIRESHYIPDPYRIGGYRLQEYNVLMNDFVAVYRDPVIGFPRKIATSPSDNDTFAESVKLAPTRTGLSIEWHDNSTTHVPESALYLWHWTGLIDAVAFFLVAMLLRARGQEQEVNTMTVD